MSQATQRLKENAVCESLDDDQINAISALMEDHAQAAIDENQNLLRTILEESASRLRDGGPRYEIADQLLEAASASFESLCSQNVEIEVDEHLQPPKPRTQAKGHPVLNALYSAVQLRDGITAIEISGHVPSEERQTEYKSALLSLRDVLNTHLKESN